MPSKGSYTFAGWSTTKDVSSTKVTSVTISGADVTVYALWNIDYYIPTYNYTVTYYDNFDSVVISVPSPQTKNIGVELKLSTEIPVYSGYTFTVWNTKSDGTGTSYAPGASLNVDTDLALFAQWSSVTPPTVIPESPPPIGPSPVPVTPILENPVPGAVAPVIAPAVTPQTGDNSNILLLAILAVFSAAGLGTVGIITRKKKRSK